MYRSLAYPASLIAALTAIALGACDGSSTGSAGTARDASDTSSPITLSPSPGTISNTPEAEFWVVDNEGAAGLELVSSNLVPDPTSRLHFVQWYGEVRNNGANPACYVYITLDFRTPGGKTRVQAMTGGARGALYTSSKTTSLIPCIPPGKTAGVYGNDIPAAPLQLSAIGKVELTFEQSLIYPDAAMAPSSPGIESVAIVEDAVAGRWVVSGTLKATAALASVRITAFPKSSAGLILGELNANQAGPLAAGASWAFKTTAYVGEQASSSILYVDFEPGT